MKIVLYKSARLHGVNEQDIEIFHLLYRTINHRKHQNGNRLFVGNIGESFF